jgi:hypothetical protein
MSDSMTNAERIVTDLEQRRSHLMTRAVALCDQRGALAYDAIVHSSFTARIELRELDDQLERLASEGELIELALFEAQRRAAQPDFREQWRTITKTEISA